MYYDGCTDHHFFLLIIPVTPHEKYNAILLNIICIDRMLASLNNTLQILVKRVGLVDVLVF